MSSTTESSNLLIKEPIVNKTKEIRRTSNLSTLADKIINNTFDEKEGKSNDNSPTQLRSEKESSPSKETSGNKILFIDKATSRNPNIIPAYDSEGESIVDDEHEDVSDLENMDFDQGAGEENSYVTENGDGYDYESKRQLKLIQLKARLYTLGNKM